MHSHLITAMCSPPPLVHLRIAYRCLRLAWAESEWLQPLVVAAAILAVMFAPIVYVV